MAKDFSQMNEQEQSVILDQFKLVGSSDSTAAAEASELFAEAIEAPLREVILSGDNGVDSIYTVEDHTNNPRIEYPLDLLTPGQERDYVAYVYSGEGRMPERRVTGDYLMVPDFEIANSIDIRRSTVRDARWNVVARAMEILEAGFRQKKNDDGWQTLISAAKDRGLLVFDPNAAVGQFTPRAVTIMQNVMRRNGGGNSGSKMRSRLTDIYMSPEAHTDIRAWSLTEVPDEVRKNIYYASDSSPDLITVFGTRLHALDEFGEGQEYQTYYATTLSGSMAASDVEIMVGLDQQRNDSFVMPIRETLSINEDPTVRRRGIVSWYGTMSLGFAVLDSRRVLLASC